MGLSYWEKMAEEKPLPDMKQPCKDCAVVTEFYRDHAEDLAKQPKEIQEKARKSWFCHDHPNRACRGLKDFLDKQNDS